MVLAQDGDGKESRLEWCHITERNGTHTLSAFYHSWTTKHKLYVCTHFRLMSITDLSGTYNQFMGGVDMMDAMVSCYRYLSCCLEFDKIVENKNF